MDKEKALANKQAVPKGREELAKTFWYTVRIKLKEKGKSITWLADQTGLSRQSVATAISINSTVRIQTAIRIAKALDCTVGELVYGARARKSTDSGTPISQKIGYLNPELQQLISDNFGGLTIIEQKALLIHAASYLGISAEDILKEVWV